MYNETMRKPRFTGEEFTWNIGGSVIVYIADTVKPPEWRVFNISCPDEAKDCQEFRHECKTFNSRPRA